VPVAIAVLSESGSVERATRAFVDRFDPQGASLAACSRDVELISAGKTDRLTVLLDGSEADLVAVVDRHGRRRAVLTIPTARDAAAIAPASPVFEEPLDESPAIVWLKDLDGRYLLVNRRYLEQLGTDPEQVCGRTDAELTPARSIEGRRLEENDTAGWDHLELEYQIGAFEDRPAFAALRFALRDHDGQPTATCSVAAPVAEVSLARSECDRLMRIDRWARLDAFAIRQELLEEWGLTLADGSSGPPLDRDDRVAAALAERDEALATAARLEEELSKGREQLGGLRAESERAAQRGDELEQSLARGDTRVSELEAELTAVRAELDGAAAAEQTRSNKLEKSLARGEARVTELEGELTRVRAELEEHLLGAERVAVALAERDEALATAARLEKELSMEREQLGSLRAEWERDARRADELARAVAAEQAQSEELERSLGRGETRVSELEGELRGVRAELEEQLMGAERVAAALPQRDEALATAARLQEELSMEREQLGSLRAEWERDARRADELASTVAAEQARSEELEKSLARRETHVSELDAELTGVRAELEEHLRRAEAHEPAAPAPESSGVKWGTGSQRALSAALLGLTEWLSVLKHVVGALGSEGGWDATIAWCPNEPRGSMTCGAMWVRDPAVLATFETRTWQHRQDASIAEFGRARSRMSTTCLLELQSAEDPLLRVAATEGMGSALLVPISDGGEMIAMLELLSRTTTAPNAELMVSLDAIALQLGATAQLIKLADVPRWRSGRL
jgi:PAS domain-containing protein